jgi:hypothetical protein
MGRRLVWLLAGSVVLLALAESSAQAAPICLRAAPGCSPRLDFDLNARVSPGSLPKKKLAPVGFRVGARVRHSDGTQPPALREAILEVENVEVDVKGLPVCRNRALRVPVRRGGKLRRVKRACGDAILGSGRVGFLIGYPQLAPAWSSSEVTLFNGGVRGGVIVLFALAEARVPMPRTLTARIEVERIEKGRYGSRVKVKVPVIAGGRGSLTDLSLRLRRRPFSDAARESFLSARCPNGRLRIEARKILFRDEASVPGAAPRTLLRGNLRVPCQLTRS